MKAIAIFAVLVCSVQAFAGDFTTADLECTVSTKNEAREVVRSEPQLITCELNGDGCNGYAELMLDGKQLVIKRSQSSVALFNGLLEEHESNPQIGLSRDLPNSFVVWGSKYSMSCNLK